MPDTARIGLTENTSYLRLGTLVRLRWMAVAGQTAAVLVVHFGLSFSLPLAGCLAIVAISVGLNALLTLWFPVGLRLSDRAATALLGFDVLQLAGLLYLTGGLANPFSMMFLAPVMISAAALPPWRTVGLGALAVVAAGLLGLWSEPLPWDEAALDLPATYRAGVWLAILLGVVFLGVYAWRVTQEARELAQALTATEFVLAREQHLSQLDGLAAAAAHELGTPLATIALVSKELARNGPKEGPQAEDIALLRQQVERCRGILAKLTSLGNEPAGPLGTMTLSLLLEEVAGPHRPFDVEIAVTTNGKDPEPTCRRNPGLIYGLGNLIENAVDFALNSVAVSASWDTTSVRVEIVDDGPGFPTELLGRIGEPYLSARGARRAKDGGGGMGLGLFIAKSLLERSGATLVFGNAPGGGARVTVTWPRLSFERSLGPGVTQEAALPF